MTEQAKAGHVGGAGRTGGDRSRGGCGVGLGHRPDRRRHGGVVDDAALLCGGDDPDAERLGQHKRLPGPQAGVGEHAIGVNLTDDSHAVFGFGIVDGMTTCDDEAALVGDVLAAEEHVA